MLFAGPPEGDVLIRRASVEAQQAGGAVTAGVRLAGVGGRLVLVQQVRVEHVELIALPCIGSGLGLLAW